MASQFTETNQAAPASTHDKSVAFIQPMTNEAQVFKNTQAQIVAAFAPKADSRFSIDADYRLDLKKLSRIIGILALAIPFMLTLGAFFWECPFDSISHYYYSSILGGFFVIALAFVGTFLIAYRGESPHESKLANVAGLAAFAVAFFPTSGDGGCGAAFTGRAFVTPAASGEGYRDSATHVVNFELFEYADVAHYIGAIVVFLSLLMFCFFVFTRVDNHHRIKGEPNGAVLPAKIRRNVIYRTCGITILLSLLPLGGYFAATKWLGFSLMFWNDLNLTFVFEATSLIAFGVAWAVRGRIFACLEDPEERKNLEKIAGCNKHA